MTIVNSPLKVPGDVLVHCESLEYCTKTVKIRNPSASQITLSNIVGFPLVAGDNGADYNLAVAGDEANVVALLLDGPSGQADEVIPATTNGTQKYQALVHPPAIINQDKIATADQLGAAFTVATIVTALRALLYEVRTEPVQSSTL